MFDNNWKKTLLTQNSTIRQAILHNRVTFLRERSRRWLRLASRPERGKCSLDQTFSLIFNSLPVVFTDSEGLRLAVRHCAFLCKKRLKK